MKTLLCLLLCVLLCGSLTAQIRAGATPMSVSNIMEQALNANGLWEWNGYAQNIGTTNATLSVTGFALDFIQLEQLTPAEVTDIFTQKVRMSGWGRAAQIAGFAGAIGLLVTGQGYVALGARSVSTMGLLTYGSTQLQPLFLAQEPSISAAIAGMLTADVVLAPGQGVTFKIFASNTGPPIGPGPLTARRTVSRKSKGTPALAPIGPVILTPVPTAIPPARREDRPNSEIPSATHPVLSTDASFETPLQPSSAGPNEALDYALLWMRQ